MGSWPRHPRPGLVPWRAWWLGWAGEGATGCERGSQRHLKTGGGRPHGAAASTPWTARCRPHTILQQTLAAMVWVLNSTDAAAEAAAASGPSAGTTLQQQVVQRAREGAADGQPDYVEVGGAGRRWVCAAGCRWPRRGRGGRLGGAGAGGTTSRRCSALLPPAQEMALDFQGQQFQKCKPLLKVVGVDNPQARLWWVPGARSCCWGVRQAPGAQQQSMAGSSHPPAV